MKKINRKLIGRVAVDSGQLIITDPCYLTEWKDNDFKEDPNDRSYSYSGASNTTCYDKDQAGNIGSSEGEGLAVRSGYGDGLYPVYANYQDGRVRSVTIKFF